VEPRPKMVLLVVVMVVVMMVVKGGQWKWGRRK
jgi:hypothetical protein